MTRPVMAASAAVLLAVAIAIADPRSSTSVALVATVAAAALVVGLRLIETSEVVARPLAPFGPPLDRDPPSVETPDVTEILREIERADRVVPPIVSAELRRAARGRLLDEHRLDLDLPADRRRAAELLGPTLTELCLTARDDIPLRRLPDMIEEIDQL